MRDASTARHRVTRYSPYSSMLLTRRRGSVSSLCSSPSDLDRVPLRSCSTSPHPPLSPRLSRRFHDKLPVHFYTSTSDLSANMPISSYVRRKTPCTSPSSPAFPLELQCDSHSCETFTIPTLPTLLPSSGSSSDSFPNTPSDSELMPYDPDRDSPTYSCKSLDTSEPGIRRSRRHIGLRISTPPCAGSRNEIDARRHSFAHIV